MLYFDIGRVGATRQTAVEIQQSVKPLGIELVNIDQTQKAGCDFIWVENRGIQPNETLGSGAVLWRSYLCFLP